MRRLMATWKEFVTLMLCSSVFHFTIISYLYMLPQKCDHYSDIPKYGQLDSVSNINTRPLLVLGILSADDKRLNRDTQRQTWISHALNADIPFKFKYKFLIDEPTVETETENEIYNDIVYLNVKTHGWAKKYGEKLYIWFKYINEHYPDASLGGKVDDDVYVCVPHLFNRLYIFQSHTLHYGWSHPIYKNKLGHIDEMFVIIGDKLIERIAKRKFCFINTTRGCDLEEHDWGDKSLEQWLSTYNDVDRQADNRYLINIGRDQIKEFAPLVNKTFCDRWILYHKAMPNVMRKLHAFQMLPESERRLGPVTGNVFSGQVIRKIPLQQNNMYIDDVKKDTNVSCDNWAVVTTIYNVTDAVNAVANTPGWCLVIVGDTLTPAEDSYMKPLSRKRVKFLSYRSQGTLYPELSKSIPSNNFGRKNMGYIYAIHHGALFIWDFDDDNKGLVDLNDFNNNSTYFTACETLNESKLNPYPYFGVKDNYTWPRGFPLQHIKNKKVVPRTCALNKTLNIGVIQSLANIQPDVDAIYRLTHDMPLNFTSKKSISPLVIPRDVYTPFNAQATLWTRSAFAFLPLPISVSGRVSDIWRSYIAQFFMHKKNVSLVFSRPYVYHLRNEHSDIKDFNAEKDLYEKSDQLVEFLISSEAREIETLKHMYTQLYIRGYIEIEDFNFIMAWKNTYEKIIQN